MDRCQRVPCRGPMSGRSAGRRRSTGRAAGLGAVLLALLAGCAAEEAGAPDPPSPIEELVRRTLVKELVLEDSFGIDQARLSLHTVELSGADYLALVVDCRQGEPPVVAYLPAKLAEAPEGTHIEVAGAAGRSLEVVLPLAEQLGDVTASTFFSTVEVESDLGDGRVDRLRVDLEETADGGGVLATLEFRRFGPAGFMGYLGFDGEVVYEQAPVTIEFRRSLAPQRATVYLAKRPR